MIFKNRTIYISLIVFLLSFVVCFSLLCPDLQTSKYVANGEIIEKQTVEDIVFWYDCEVADSGIVSVTGGDAHINFETPRCSSATLKYKNSDNLELYVFYSQDGTFTEENKILVQNFSKDDYITFPLPQEARHLRIDFSQNLDFEGIEFNDAEPSTTMYKVPISAKRYILAVLASIFCAVITWIIDKKTRFFDLVFESLKRGSNNAIVLSCSAVILGGVSYIAEFFYSKYFDAYATFSLGRFSFITAVLFLTFSFAYLFKQIKEKPETFVALCVFTLGVVIILGQPFAHNSWDIDSHYRWAHNASFIGTAYDTMADMNVVGVSREFYVESDLLKTKNTINNMNQWDVSVVCTHAADTLLSHRPSGIFMAIARLFGASFYQKYLFGELANVILYATLCYFGMKRLKSGKMLYALIALFPTTLFLAANYSYDFWVTGFIMLGMAYFIGELQRPDEPITILNTIIMCGAFALGSLPKLTYVFVLLIPLFMKKKGLEKTDKKKYYAICIAFIIVFFGMLALRGFSSATGSGDSRGGSEVNAFEQVKYIVGNPFEYAKTLYDFLSGYLSVSGSRGYITNFAYLGLGTGYLVFVVLIAITAFTDKNEFDRKSTNWLYRFLAVLLFVGVAMFVATALYISFTAVGSNTISGCQPRYLIPIVYPLVALIGPTKLNNKLNRCVYNTAIIIPAVTVCMLNIWDLVVMYY